MKSPENMLVELKKIGDLKEEGIITEAEFEKLKS